jgi:glycosyltransferase involved in cell wall biosynthesis
VKAWISEDYCQNLVSVIVPCYNRARIILETLESVLNQTYRPIELLVVDDGSSDDSREVVEEWIVSIRDREEANIEVKTLHQENSGPSMARNTGLLACNGEYIHFLDSDEILHQEKFKIQVEVIKKNKKDFCVCNYKRFSDSIEDIDITVDFFSRSHSIEDFPLVYPFKTSAPLYMRNAIVTGGPWNTALRAGEDFEFNFRLVCRGAKGVWINSVLLYVREHDSEERIQATPLRSRYRFMYHGLAEMEMEAMERGLCTKKLLKNLGLRALTYFEHMRAENDAHLGRIFFDYAKCRVPWWRFMLFLLNKRIWTPFWKAAYPAGPRILIKKVIWDTLSR